MSAYHPELPHGAGLIMISCAYFETLISKHACDEKFIDMAKFLGLQSADQPEDFIRALKKLQSDCGVSDLKMSDYGITSDEFEKFVKNARGCMGFLFDVDAAKLSDDDCMRIYENSYK
jgi:alcohol dehydrogenase